MTFHARDVSGDLNHGSGERSGLDPEDAEDGAAESDDDFEIEIALDTRAGRLACVYTMGLWWYGIPELYISPPPDFVVDLAYDDGDLAVVLAAGLVELGRGLLDSDDAELPPHSCEFRGQSATLWLDRTEAPEGALAVALPAEVDTVYRVECSLWHPAPARVGER
jgi:hypothetical protein